MRPLLLGICCVLACARPAWAQNAERQDYTMSSSMRSDLESRQFDPGRVEQIVNGVSKALAGKTLQPILDQASPDIRVTEGTTNKVIKKERLAAFKDKLLNDPQLRSDIVDESQFILKGDEVGLARGTFWLDLQCLNEDCTEKKTSIVTINLR